MTQVLVQTVSDESWVITSPFNAPNNDSKAFLTAMTSPENSGTASTLTNPFTVFLLRR